MGGGVYLFRGIMQLQRANNGGWEKGNKVGGLFKSAGAFFRRFSLSLSLSIRLLFLSRLLRLPLLSRFPFLTTGDFANKQALSLVYLEKADAELRFSLSYLDLGFSPGKD